MQRTRSSGAPLVLALGYLLLLLPLLLHRHPVRSLITPAASASVHAATSFPSGEDLLSSVGDECLLCNLLQLSSLGFIALLIAFVLRQRAEYFPAFSTRFSSAPRLRRTQPRAPPAFS